MAIRARQKGGDSNLGVRISGDADDRLDQVAAHFGMNKKELFGRLLRWFTEQPRRIQAAALQVLPDDADFDVAEMIYAEILRRRRGGQESPEALEALSAELNAALDAEQFQSAPKPRRKAAGG